MDMVVIAVLLIVLAILVNEVFKRTCQHGRGGKNIYCRVCGQTMYPVSAHWAYRLPFEVWAIVAKYKLRPDVVRRYLCPNKHSQVWFLPSPSGGSCEVLVTKDYSVS